MFELPDWLVMLVTFCGASVAIIGLALFFTRMATGRGGGGGLGLAGFGGLLALSPTLIPSIASALVSIVSPSDADGTRDGASEAPQPEPTPEPTPEPSEPMDLTLPLTILIIAVSLAVLAGVGYGGCRLAASAKRRREATKQTQVETVARWDAARKLHTQAVATVASYELDVAKAIDYPAFNDITVPEVSAMSKAMRRAQDIEFQTDKNKEIGGTDELLASYRDAVDEFVTAVEVAEATARRIRWKSVPPAERKLMWQAKNLLVQAEDPGNPENMRHTLYERLKKTIDQLNEAHGSKVVPTRTVGEIEEQTRLLLEAPGALQANNAAQHEPFRL